jgi:hypothetical protein
MFVPLLELASASHFLLSLFRYELPQLITWQFVVVEDLLTPGRALSSGSNSLHSINEHESFHCCRCYSLAPHCF